RIPVIMNTDSGQAERSSVAGRSLELSLSTERTPQDGSLEATDAKTSRRSPTEVRQPAPTARHRPGVRARAGHRQHVSAAGRGGRPDLAAAGGPGRCRARSAALHPAGRAGDGRPRAPQLGDATPGTEEARRHPDAPVAGISRRAPTRVRLQPVL